MAASKVEVLEQIARGFALDLLDAMDEVESVDAVTIDVHNAHGLPSVGYTAWSNGHRVWCHNLVGDELPTREA